MHGTQTMDPHQRSFAWEMVCTSGYEPIGFFGDWPLKWVSKTMMRALMRYMREFYQDIRMRYPDVEAAQIWFDPPRFRRHPVTG